MPSDPLTELAVELNADAKATRARKAKEKPADDIVQHTDEAELTTALDRLEALVDESDFDASTLVGDIRDCMLDIVKSRPKPWSQLSSAEQGDVARTVEYAAQQMVKNAVDLIARNGKTDPVKAILETLSEKKDGTIEAKLKIKTTTPEETAAAFLALHHARGKMVLMTKASAEDYGGQRADVGIDPDQMDIDFQPTGDEPLPY